MGLRTGPLEASAQMATFPRTEERIPLLDAGMIAEISAVLVFDEMRVLPVTRQTFRLQVG